MIDRLRPLLSNKRNWISFVLVLIGAIVLVMIAPLVPPGVDWRNAFRPATLELLHGRSPYTADGFYNPVWALFPLIPFALLPEEIGRVFLAVVALGSLAYTAKRLGASPISLIALLLSPLVLHEVLNGNIDWLVALGVVMPPWLGLFFVVVKPQIGVAIVIFWLFSTWKEGGIRKTVVTFIPVTIAFGISLILYGWWPLLATQAIDKSWNSSLWPVSIPMGLALLVTAIRKNDIRYAMGASPCLSPYLVFHSWVIALLSIASSAPEMVVTVVGLWILVAIRFAGG